MSERTRAADNVSWWLVATTVHLSGVVSLGVASYLDRNGMSSWIVEPLAYWGLATLIVGPAAVLALINKQLVAGWQVPVAIGVTCAIEFTAILAMLPLIQ